MLKRVRITVVQLKSGRWRGTVYADGENFAGVDGPDFLGVLQQTAHYAAGLSPEASSGPGWMS
ncbi:hypothetical protein SEA_NICKY22_30 [Microbacterium phage Nicky22]|nr:hypothetical protein SEA_NICKY22_30 [Microbacterium phage Nicky22]